MSPATARKTASARRLVPIPRLAPEAKAPLVVTAPPKLKIREATMASTNPEFMDQQKLFWVPTAILFVNGKEQRRWELNHLAWEFRDDLNAAGGRPLFSGTTVAQKGDKPAGTPVVDANGCIEGVGCPIDRPPPATVGKANGTGNGAKGPVVP